MSAEATPRPLPDDLRDALEPVQSGWRWLRAPVHYFPSTGSTNDVAAALATVPASHGAVVLADRQTSGRGRRGHIWFSPDGAGLYVSLVLAPAQARVTPARATALLTVMAGVALAEAVEAATGLAPAIKWPNDLYVGRRKLAGILAEGVTHATTASVSAVVLGFGLNVRASAYPPALAHRVTSLESELGRAIDRPSVLAHALTAIDRRYAALLDGSFDAILDAWRARAPRGHGARVRWATPAGERHGLTCGIDADGALLVFVDGRQERLVAGEVHWDDYAARD